MLHRLEGVVIRTMDYGEGHKILTLMTERIGKISVMARGAKKTKSRYSAVTQLFTYGDFVIFKGGGMGTLNQGELIDSHHKLREEIHLAAYASYLVELVDRMMPDNEPNNVIFEQLKAGLTVLEEGKDPLIILHIMEMKMLAVTGYLPELQECVSCGSDEGTMALSNVHGGILCPRCRAKDPSAIPLSDGPLKLLRLFQQMDLRRLGAISVKPETKNELKHAMRSFIDAHMDVKWKSRSFLDQMDKYGI